MSRWVSTPNTTWAGLSWADGTGCGMLVMGIRLLIGSDGGWPTPDRCKGVKTVKMPVAKAPIGTRPTGPAAASTAPSWRPTDRRSGHHGQSQHESDHQLGTALADFLQRHRHGHDRPEVNRRPSQAT